MRRKPKIKYKYGIYTHFPLFTWRKCTNCGNEFKWEKGYRYIVSYYGKDWCYLCKTCAPNRRKAHILAKNYHYSYTKPTVKPSPGR